MPRKLAPDLWLFGVAVVLLSVGVVMVYSASAIVAGDRFHDPYFCLKRQLCWGLLGAAGLWVALRVDYRRLERFVLPLLVVSVALLVLVLIPPIGQAINGTRRWIRLGPVSFQPAELAKLTLVVYLAAFLAKNHEALDHFRQGLLPPLVVAGVFGAPVLAQPDLGNCLTLVAPTFPLVFLGAVAIVALFMVLVWRGLRIGLRAPDPFGAYLALGITVLIAIQTLVNLGVVMGLLPTKGLPLPFISFGGSALLVTMLSTGVLLNISQHAHV